MGKPDKAGGPACLISGCREPVAGRCALCGRPYCGEHGGPAHGYGGLCRECYAQMLEGMVAACGQAGQLPAAISALDGAAGARPGSGDPPERHYYGGLARAAGADLDGGIGELQTALSRNGQSGLLAGPAKHALALVHSARGVRRLAAQDTLGAVDDLREAVNLAEDSTAQRSVLAALVHQSAYAYWQAGRLTDALREWEEAQRSDMQDGQVAHYLAIAYYRLACEAEAQDPASADTYWRQAIAHWVQVLLDRPYWEQWAAARGQAIGQVDESQIQEMRQDLIARLRADFRDYRTRYLEQKRPDQAARHARLEVAFVRELRSAEEMAAARDARGGGSPRVAGGPLLIDRWQGLPGGPALAGEAKALARTNFKLASYLSPLGAAYTMVKDLKRYDDALVDLRRYLKDQLADTQARELFVEALLARAHELDESGSPEAALALLEEAAGTKVQAGQVLPYLAQVAIRSAQPMLENDDKIQGAITILERLRSAYSIADNEFKALLAQAYFKRGLLRNKQEDHAGSLADLRKAMEIDPNNEAAKQNLVAAMMNRAAELNQREQYDEALKLINEAIEINPGQVNRDLVAAVLTNRAIGMANRAVQNHIPGQNWFTKVQLQNALNDLQTAQKMMPGNDHIRQQIAVIRGLLAQLG